MSMVKWLSRALFERIKANLDIPGYINIILRAITSTNFMTAEPYEFDFGLLKRIVRRIVNEVDGVSRVTYNVTSKPPGIFIQANQDLQPLTLNRYY